MEKPIQFCEEWLLLWNVTVVSRYMTSLYELSPIIEMIATVHGHFAMDPSRVWVNAWLFNEAIKPQTTLTCLPNLINFFYHSFFFLGRIYHSFHTMSLWTTFHQEQKAFFFTLGRVILFLIIMVIKIGSDVNLVYELGH